MSAETNTALVRWRALSRSQQAVLAEIAAGGGSILSTRTKRALEAAGLVAWTLAKRYVATPLGQDVVRAGGQALRR